MSENRENGLIFIFCYLFTWFSGIIVYVIYGSKREDFRFHSVQAILLGVIILVITVISFVLGRDIRFISLLGELVAIILWLYGMYVGYKAYKGVDISMPVIGNLAK
ncbi:MAG: hypothetical protein ACYCSO_09430 [Cuniculiplasma sp.]